MKIVLLCLCLLPTFLLAQDRIYTYNAEIEGMPSEIIKSVIDDQYGFLWVATDDGLSRFDGKHFLKIPNLPTNYIKGFLKRKNGDLLVFHDQGIHQIFSQPDTAYVKTFIEGSTKRQENAVFYPKAIFESSDQTIWIGENRDIVAYRNNKLTRYSFDEKDNADSYVRSYQFFEDKQNNIWALSFNGVLFFFNKEKNIFEQKNLNGTLSQVQSLSSLTDSTYWVGTQEGVFEMLLSKKENRISKIFSLRGVSYLFKQNNEIYIGTWSNGLYKTDVESRQLHQETIKAKAISSIYVQDQNIWISTNEGFLLMQLNFFKSIRFENTQNFINHLTQYQDKIYVTDGTNIHVLCKEKQWQECELISPNAGMLTSFFLKNDTIWLANGIGQISTYDLHSKKTRLVLDKKLGHTISAIFLDETNNTIWAACPDVGLVIKIKNQKITYYQDDKGLKNPVAFAENKSGEIFVLQKGKNDYLLKYNPKTDYFDNLSVSDSLPDDMVVHDADFLDEKMLYLATSHGVYMYDIEQKKIKKLALANFSEQTFKAIRISKNGTIWLGFSSGLLSYQNKQIISYNHLSGLPSKSITYRCLLLGNSDDRIWIGTSTGLALGKENTENHIKKTKKPIFIQTKIDGKKIGLGKKAIFESASFLTFHFLSLDFPLEQLHYQYRILGKDSLWVSLENKTELVLPLSKTGKFRLEIRATKSGGFLESESLIFDFEVVSPWYKTGWAVLLYVALLGVFLYVGYLFNEKQSKVKTKRLENLIAQRTEEIKFKNKELESKQQEVLVQNEELRQQQEEILAQRDSISKKNQELTQQTEKIEAASRNMSIISQIGQQITATLDLEKAVTILYQHIQEIMDAEEFGVGIYDDLRGIISYDFYIYQGEKMDYFTSSIQDDRFSSWVIKNQKPIFLGDIRLEYDNYIQNFKHYEGDNLLNSMICTPLIINEKIIGLMSVQSPKKHAYSDYHFDILQALTSYMSIAIANISAYQLIEQKNRHITDSIRYAQDIQHAILPSHEKISQFFDNYFIIFKPKDIVSGDFYWFAHVQNKTFVAVVDCTGHGVPGAFMSMIANTLLNEIVNIEKVFLPHQILEALHQKIRLVLQQENHQNQDGMDVSLCCIEPYQHLFRVSFSGAKSSLIFTDKHSLEKIKGNRHSVGGFQKEENRHFSNHELFLAAGSQLYLYSDGFIDQSNPQGKRLGSQLLYTWIEQVHRLPFAEQKQFFCDNLAKFQQHTPQRDDITFWALQV